MLNQGIVAGLFTIFLAFLCTILGIQAYVPQHKVAMAFNNIFQTFELGATSVITVVAVAVVAVVSIVALAIVAAVPIGTGLGGFFAYSKGLIWYSDARIRRAEAKKVEVEAGLILTSVPAGSTLFASEVSGWLPIEHKPLSLSPGRVNGSAIQHTTEEKARWSFFHLAHSTAKRDSALEMPALGPGYPQSVNLIDLLPNGASFNNVILGLHVAEDGSQHIVSDSMEELTHVAIGGSSGWGKSVALRSLAYQMATCEEEVKLAFIDSEDMTFTPFKSSNRLLYPVADNVNDALAIVGELAAEMGRRKVLFAQYPTVEKLSDFNRVSDEPLPYILLFADEVTALLKTNKQLEQMLTLQILRARKYGILVVLGGQSWKANEIDTTIRGMFSTVVHFHSKDKSSSNVLLGSGVAAEIQQKGIAYAVLPGRPMIEFLSPNISLASAMREIGGTPATVEMPSLPEPELVMDFPKPTEKQEQILKLWDAGNPEGDLSSIAGKIAANVYSNPGGRQRELVEATLKKFSRI